MNFQHSERLRHVFPQLVAGTLVADGVTAQVHASSLERVVTGHVAAARAHLADVPESKWPQVQAWRRAFSAMGLKPTRHRCASEALLRRLRQHGSLPHAHPLVEVCNALSAASGIPVGVFDLEAISGNLQVRHATGDERYLTFAGELEHPDAEEVIFADDAAQAHSRRWTNRQSARSAVRDDTRTVLIVAEALHENAVTDVTQLTGRLVDTLHALWRTNAAAATLTATAPPLQLHVPDSQP